MLLSLSVVLSFFSIQLSESIKIGVGFVVTVLLGLFYGPVAGGIAAGAGDLIKYLIKPTGAYFPGFTLTAILAGVIYGIFFYKSGFTVKKAIFAKLLVNLTLNSLLNTVWVSILYGKGVGVLLIPRVIKNLISYPFEVILLIVVVPVVVKLMSRSHSRVA